MTDSSFKVTSDGEGLPEYRLVPDDEGTYTLEEYIPLAGYITKVVRVKDLEEGREKIKNLKRKILYP